ncbi:MAG: class I SAM-dependent methyltransferase [Geodermatophilaceae bacterium]|jgi:SAM-dependent methyltransferase
MVTSRRRKPEPASLAQSTGLQSEVLEDLRSAVNYRSWLVALTDPWLGDDPLEIGSGLGDYAELWARSGRVTTVSEADPGRLAGLSRRFADRGDVMVRELAVPITDTAQHSAVVAVNVVEHIQDDVAALRSFAGLLRPGGRVVLIVPAFQFAMSGFDREIGHFRRYRVASMTGKLTAAGLHPLHVGYLNSLGLLGWLVFVRLLGGRPREGLLLTGYDKLVVPVLRRAERQLRPPFGQSVLAVAEKPV